MHRPPHSYFDLDVLTTLADTFESLGDHLTAAIVFCAEEELLRARPQRLRRHRPHRPPVLAGRRIAAPRCRRSPRCRAAVGVASASRSRPTSRIATPGAVLVQLRASVHQGFGISVTLPAVVGNSAFELMYTRGR
jgi:hypothetical protein